MLADPAHGQMKINRETDNIPRYEITYVLIVHYLLGTEGGMPRNLAHPTGGTYGSMAHETPPLSTGWPPVITEKSEPCPRNMYSLGCAFAGKRIWLFRATTSATTFSAKNGI